MPEQSARQNGLGRANAAVLHATATAGTMRA
jgi:hypothetical protein